MRYLTPILIVILIGSLIANGVMWARWRNTRTVVSVNGKSITKKDMDDWLELNYAPAYKAGITKRILIDDEAGKQKVAPSESEVNEQYSLEKELNYQFAAQVRQNPWRADELKNEIKEKLETARLLTKDIPVTDAELEEEYKAHPELYDTPNKARTEFAMVLNEARTDDIQQLLNKGMKPQGIMDSLRRDVVFLGDNSVFTISQQLGSQQSAEVFKMQPGEVKKIPITQAQQFAQQGAKAILLKMIKVEPGHKADLNDPKTKEKLRLTVAAKRSKPAIELVSTLFAQADIKSDDKNDIRTIELMLFPDRAYASQ